MQKTHALRTSRNLTTLMGVASRLWKIITWSQQTRRNSASCTGRNCKGKEQACWKL